MTNWVTVKIKEPVRDAARRDNRTYTEIMAEGVVSGGSGINDNDAEAIAEHLDDALDTASMAADPGATEEAVDDLTREVRKAQELAEQARDAAQRVEEGMGR